MRWIVFVCVGLLVSGCYVAPRRAKSCSTCQSKGRTPSYGTHIK